MENIEVNIRADPNSFDDPVCIVVGIDAMGQQSTKQYWIPREKLCEIMKEMTKVMRQNSITAKIQN
ncbi:MAG: hypothetical protein EOM54_10915 [Clostridia bacterium]|nr:hypothetical protein [Clostridia bacterium]